MMSRVTGRPRSETVQDAILAAAFGLLAERGYAGFSIEGVAAAAGSGKSTIYRWWKSRADLAVDAFFHATTDELELPETGSARDDFRLQIIGLAALLHGARGQVFAAMVGGARDDAVLGKALGERWLEPRRRWGFQRMTRAAEAGELRPGVQPGAALAVLYGPLYTPLLFGAQVPERVDVEAYLDIALAGIFRERCV